MKVFFSDETNSQQDFESNHKTLDAKELNKNWIIETMKNSFSLILELQNGPFNSDEFDMILGPENYRENEGVAFVQGAVDDRFPHSLSISRSASSGV